MNALGFMGENLVVLAAVAAVDIDDPVNADTDRMGLERRAVAQMAARRQVLAMILFPGLDMGLRTNQTLEEACLLPLSTVCVVSNTQTDSNVVSVECLAGVDWTSLMQI